MVPFEVDEINLARGIDIGRRLRGARSQLIAVLYDDEVLTIQKHCKLRFEATVVNAYTGWASQEYTTEGAQVPWAQESVKSLIVGTGVTGTSSSGWCYQLASLSDVQLGADLTTIGPHMFQKCTAIEKIDIPSKVSLIAGSAFAECSSLVEAVFESSANWIYVANKLDIAGTTVDFTDAAIAASTLTNSDYYNGFFRRVGG